ncbi:Transcriptional activator FeaR [Streptomyces sp. ADI95-16]|uniref:AraC-like ligand-binding domain-containing protein n=1 Tax=Streptomyces sp. ADI95-16 TaxID=1522758 RepID=UPI000F3A9104|nr:helix-turn-helix domain-containing protein [Streptomyces sp. ADI95-16]AYV25541.1 Transcriptional activator FeaR [Streptomyces sp. ADI95-16]
MWSTVSSGGLPAGERFEWFSDLVSREVMPTVISSERPASFHTEAAVMELGELRVSRLAYSPLRSRRTPALIRRSDPEQYQLALVSAGAMSLTQHGNDCGAGVGDLVFWDTSRPSDARSPTGDDREQQLVILQLPRTVLPLRPRQLDRLLARRIAGGSGMTPVLASFMTSLVDHGDQCTPTQLRQLGTVAADLAAACLAQRLDTEEQLPAEVRQRALVQQIHTYIEHNLGDPQLNPAVIAARHGISVRKLHQLFQGHDESVHSRIRRRRLERCRADLALPGALGRPVHLIAARWGFSGPAVFSRAFREAYGVSPTEFRALSINETCAGCTLRRSALS